MTSTTTYLLGFVFLYFAYHYLLPAIPILRPIHTHLSLFFSSMLEVADTFNQSYIDDEERDEKEEKEAKNTNTVQKNYNSKKGGEKDRKKKL